jgi:uncharacterized protein YqgV (UPF0045/DUF77 family)
LIASAQISVYPLRREDLSPAVEAVRRELQKEGLDAQVGPMSTLAIGEASCLFAALRKGFEAAASGGPVALVVTVSNACPVRERPSSGMGDL